MTPAQNASHDVARAELDEAFVEAEILVSALTKSNADDATLWNTCIQINESIDRHWKRYIANSLTRTHE